jgi:hypothetical protein
MSDAAAFATRLIDRVRAVLVEEIYGFEPVSEGAFRQSTSELPELRQVWQAVKPDVTAERRATAQRCPARDFGEQVARQAAAVLRQFAFARCRLTCIRLVG